ncbi:MAG: collagen-like protein [Paludibacteraceae bacterium]|nr:collagen-like protein [Paludibacteraceae bacterium]
MKKLLFIAITALLCACVGPEGPRGPQGPKGDPGEGMYKDVVWFTIEPGDWLLDTEAPKPYYHYGITGEAVAKLDEYAAREGLLFLYVYPYGVEEDEQGNYKGDQALLPYNRYYKDYSCIIDYEFYPGEISIYVTRSDDKLENPGTYTFRLVTLW